MPEAASNSFPKQIKYIVGNEACERFSFYGMKSILVIFMTTHLMIAAGNAEASYHLFVSACYLLPLLGGFLADRFLGKYKTVLYLSFIYCLGHFVLAMSDSREGLYWGLGFIALGTGAIKPCVSAIVGDQFNKSNEHLLKKVFDWFYFSINFGSFFSTLLIPFLLVKSGPNIAFGIPGVLMAIATFIFWLGRKQYVMVPPTGKNGPTGFMSILLYSLTHTKDRKEGQSMLDVAKAKYPSEDVEAAKSAADIFKVFFTVSIFWALYDQNGSSWVLQAEKMDRNIWGMHLEAAQIQAINPILVMILIPFFSFVVYPLVEKFGFKVTPLRKMSAGMLTAAFSFIIVALIQSALDSGHNVNVIWQGLAFLILTCSEVMVSITGLEFAYTQAPRSMKSTIMSFWLLTVFAGNFLTAFIAKANVFEGAMYFYFFAALMFVVSFIFVWSAIRYKVRDFIEKASSGTSGTFAAESGPTGCTGAT
jgi:POT family proton-dependent oligopeptide transporter